MAPSAKQPWQLVATPPRDAAGVASMLVALGDARIEVTYVTPEPNVVGRYVLQIDRPDGSLAALLGIGAVVHSLGPPAAQVAGSWSVGVV